MDDLFRFVSVRPAQASDAKTVSIAGDTPFQETVRGHLELNMPPEEIWAFVRMEAQRYVGNTTDRVVTNIKSLNFYEQYTQLRSSLASPDGPDDFGSLNNAILDVFGDPASSLEDDRSYVNDRSAVWDSIILIFLLPRLQRGPFVALTEVAQIIDIIHRAAASDESLGSREAIQTALFATVILPDDLFPNNPSRLRPVGIADLLVVKQHIHRYELGEIVNIENILKGETRKKMNKHGLSNERTIVVSTTNTTETTTELSTTERFSLKREAENTVKEDINAKAGMQVSSKYGTTEFSANASFDYANSKTDSQRTSSDYGKDVTSRAATKVTESIRVQQTTRVLETWEEDEHHTFDNSKGTRNISGIYQWVNKIYTAQVFNYGKRLLFDIMVPEPASLLLDAASITAQSTKPTPPLAFNKVPTDLLYGDADITNENYYGKFLGLYDVEGVGPPPLDNISVAKTFALAHDDKATDKNAEIAIPEGYEAIQVGVTGTYNFPNSNSSGMGVWVAEVYYDWKPNQFTPPTQDPGSKYSNFEKHLSASVGVAIVTTNATDYAVAVELICQPTLTTKHQWQLDTHSKILAAYRKKLRDYQDALASQRMTQTTGPIGSTNPEINRGTERTELKRGAIQLLSQQDLLQFNDIITDQPSTTDTPAQLFPRPNFFPAVQDGEFARFFEQAFEWEQIQYIFYPYYWSRKSVWYEKATLTNSDPLFAEFLKAGQARVVVPVRPSMEPAVWYYLMTGQPWMGGDPPLATDGNYLSIAEEIKEATGAPGTEAPYGPSWEVVVPTTLIKLRDGDVIADVKWDLEKPWTWTASAENGEADGELPSHNTIK